MANMLSGSALMDGALLLVAANEKVPKPQTKEHLLALQTLNIQQIVVVQNKVDLVSYKDAISNYQDITKFVKGTHAAKAPIIPISAQSGLNIDALIGSIESTIKTPEREEKKDTVMHVLRSFDVNKPGTKIKNIKGGVIGVIYLSEKRSILSIANFKRAARALLALNPLCRRSAPGHNRRYEIRGANDRS